MFQLLTPPMYCGAADPAFALYTINFQVAPAAAIGRSNLTLDVIGVMIRWLGLVQPGERLLHLPRIISLAQRLTFKPSRYPRLSGCSAADWWDWSLYHVAAA